MIRISPPNSPNLADDDQVWQNLKYAISATSGFQRWQLESKSKLTGLRLDQQVQKYLRETLETLAY
ncbi:hypothetical protein B7O87_11330 [Cylindrospermopsis raciborskii CENA303]|uniref:Uncharacterized protein n=1 Tax=Cylindrospermopsis raciborskii CENA303 TaxID=1170769 RepID=A0A1X4G587_9CYAN|nr:hypothetical protein [Cylindrospermopsis raciborskii]EFA71531.1 conserved hypothetical protein [Raphidiopsis brookii D9]OSO89736.1 hypothetical protein B7O87_11330 [Cylindrospermopsis raciborskii CENA303]